MLKKLPLIAGLALAGCGPMTEGQSMGPAAPCPKWGEYHHRVYYDQVRTHVEGAKLCQETSDDGGMRLRGGIDLSFDREIALHDWGAQTGATEFDSECQYEAAKKHGIVMKVLFESDENCLELQDGCKDGKLQNSVVLFPRSGDFTDVKTATTPINKSFTPDFPVARIAVSGGKCAEIPPSQKSRLRGQGLLRGLYLCSTWTTIDGAEWKSSVSQLPECAEEVPEDSTPTQ